MIAIDKPNTNREHVDVLRMPHGNCEILHRPNSLFYASLELNTSHNDRPFLRSPFSVTAHDNVHQFKLKNTPEQICRENQ